MVILFCFLVSSAFVATLFCIEDMREQVKDDYRECFTVAMALHAGVAAMALTVVTIGARGWKEVRNLPLALMEMEGRKENLVSTSLPGLAIISLTASMMAVAAASIGGDYFRVAVALLMFVVGCIVAALPSVLSRSGLGRVLPYVKAIERLSWYYLLADGGGGGQKGGNPRGRGCGRRGPPDTPRRSAGCFLGAGIALTMVSAVMFVLAVWLSGAASPWISIPVLGLALVVLAGSTFSIAMASWVFRRVAGAADDCVIAVLIWGFLGAGVLAALVLVSWDASRALLGTLSKKGWDGSVLWLATLWAVVLMWVVLLCLEGFVVFGGSGARIWRVCWFASQKEWGRRQVVEEAVRQAERVRAEKKGDKLLERIDSDMRARPGRGVLEVLREFENARKADKAKSRAEGLGLCGERVKEGVGRESVETKETRKKVEKARRAASRAEGKVKRVRVDRAIAAVEAARGSAGAPEGQGRQEPHVTVAGAEGASRQEPSTTPVTLAVPLVEPLQGELRLSLTVSYEGAGQADPVAATPAQGRRPFWRRWRQARRQR